MRFVLLTCTTSGGCTASGLPDAGRLLPRQPERTVCRAAEQAGPGTAPPQGKELETAAEDVNINGGGECRIQLRSVCATMDETIQNPFENERFGQHSFAI